MIIIIVSPGEPAAQVKCLPASRGTVPPDPGLRATSNFAASYREKSSKWIGSRLIKTSDFPFTVEEGLVREKIAP
jgi:hypothetical protein